MAAKRKRRDRRQKPIELVGYDGTRKLKVSSVEEAYGPDKTKRETVIKNVHHDAIEKLYARGIIGDAQKRAADKVRWIIEALGASGAPAFDPSKIQVDTSPSGQSISDRVIDAGIQLRGLIDEVDSIPLAIVLRVAGHGENLSQIARLIETEPTAVSQGGCSRRTRDYCGRLLKDGLTQCAGYWGYVTVKHNMGYGAVITDWQKSA